jgi:hypothetical protein
MNTITMSDGIAILEKENAILERVLPVLKLSIIIELVAIIIVAMTLMQHSPAKTAPAQPLLAPQQQPEIPL